jgi:hypothetical protein
MSQDFENVFYDDGSKQNLAIFTASVGIQEEQPKQN